MKVFVSICQKRVPLLPTSEEQLRTFRTLRKKAQDLLGTLASDLKSFHHEDGVTFRRHPDSKSIQNDVGVGTTCSCLMALALNKQLDSYFADGHLKKPLDAFGRVFAAEWKSSGLKLNNPFSTVLVIRTAGFLTEARVLDSTWFASNKKKHRRKATQTLPEIARWLIDKIERLGIEEYPPTADVVYWFVDGICRSEIALEAKHWTQVFTWARNEFNQQQSLVYADHDAQMDPVAMAMAACLCSRLRKVASKRRLGTSNADLSHLPSSLELEHSIQILFRKQTASGIWPKYFPLFHYPKAGSNFCFTFEMLEAILAEFDHTSSTIVNIPQVIEGLRLALDWCERNRQAYSRRNDNDMHQTDTYDGWNSGGELASLREGKPESWATAVVHMFLWRLQHVLSGRIRQLLLESYESRTGKDTRPVWDDLANVEISPNRLAGASNVKQVLEEQLLEPASVYDWRSPKNIARRTSVLLFGPPGTSKTTLVRAFAAKLNWPMVEIEPSDFLTKGIENVYSRAKQIFNDLADLPGIVVLFDEMDALVRTRQEDQTVPLDVMSRFLTTSMLPKLAKLHDDKRVVFFFATNYQRGFDPAIKRPGRFDILLCVGPPKWDEKLKKLKTLAKSPLTSDDVAKVKERLQSFVTAATSEQKKLLDMLTFTETATFLETVSNTGDLLADLEALTPAVFFDTLATFQETMTLRTDTLEAYEEEKLLSTLQ